MFDADNESFFEEEDDLIQVADQANHASNVLQAVRSELINLRTAQPDATDLDQDDPKFPVLIDAYDDLAKAIQHLTKVQLSFMEAAS